MSKVLQVVEQFYDVTNHRKDVAGLRPLVTDDILFSGPLSQTSGAEAYMALNEQLLSFHQETRVLAQFEAGSDVCTIYELDLKTPAGETITVPMADWIRVSNGRVAEQRIYYDPREFAKAFGM